MKHYQRLLVELAVDDINWFPSSGLPSRINLLDSLTEQIIQPTIVLDLDPALDSDLNEVEPSNVFRMLPKQQIKRFQALWNSLDVVDTVNADTKKLRNLSDSVPPIRGRNRPVRTGRYSHVLVEIDADRESSNCSVTLPHPHMCAITINLCV